MHILYDTIYYKPYPKEPCHTMIKPFYSCLRCLLFHSDPCSLEAERGPCDNNQPRYYYDRHTKTCMEFVYGGCQGNANRFNNKAQCKRECLADSGKCFSNSYKSYINKKLLMLYIMYEVP